jgi:hypothetical protein
MTPEHKEKLRVARESAAAKRKADREAGIAPPKTRGRPAAREAAAPMPRPALPVGQGDPTVEDLERMIAAVERGEVTATREVRGSVDTTFDFPEQGKRPGWVYCWWPFKITGQEVDGAQMVSYAQGGWMPVPATHFPSLVPPGWTKPVIERHGQRAYMRRETLQKEAEIESKRHAFQQKADRLSQQQTGDLGREFAPRDPDSRISADIRPLM